MRYVTLDNKRYAMREIHRLYKQQRDEERRARQLTLFDLREDARPVSQRTGDGRYREPLLFKD
jgi:hypothetical protein